MSLSVQRPSRRTTLLTATLVLLATALTAHVADAVAVRHERCAVHRSDSLLRARLVTGHGAPVFVIGDSWSVGLGVGGEASWPTRLPGRVRVAGFSGSGFTRAASPCGAQSYAARAAEAVPVGADLVLVEGGLNDTDQSADAITAGFHRLVEVLADRDVARLVVVGPAAAPARAGGAARVDQLLANLSLLAGVEYVSTLDWRLGYLPDGLHPDAAGHREFGDRVAAALG